MTIQCEECDSADFENIQSYVQVTGQEDNPTLEVITARCSICGHEGVIETRVV